MKVSIGYSDSEDRIWLRAGQGQPSWWLTRRLALELVAQWAASLERSVPLADAAELAPGDACAASPGARDRVGREHLEALAAGPRAGTADDRGALDEHGQDDGEGAPAPAGVPTLLFRVDLGTAGGRVRLVLRSAGRRQVLVMPRADSHRLLSAFVARCRGNGWLDARLPPWLEPSPPRPSASIERPAPPAAAGQPDSPAAGVGPA